VRKIGLAAAFLGVLIAVAPPAKASTYDVTFTGHVFDVVADITVGGVGGSNNVTLMTGTVSGPNGTSIVGLVPLGTQSAWTYDNMFNGLGNPYVSNPGILFTAGAWIYNLYSVGTGSSVAYYLSTYNPNGIYYNPGDLGTLSVAQTPIPAPVFLLGSVLAAGCFFLRRRRQKYGDVPLSHLSPA
jgi:hypothetical protein